MKTDKLIELITKAMTFKWKSDPSKPGLIISYLGSKGYYVAVHRFTSAFGKDKVVELSATNLVLEDALADLADRLTEDAEGLNPVQELHFYTKEFSFFENAKDKLNSVKGSIKTTQSFVSNVVGTMLPLNK